MKKLWLAAVCVFLLLQTVASAHWADPYCAVLQEKGIMFGDEQGFRPEEPLLRCEFAAMLNRAFYFPQTDYVPMQDVFAKDWYYTDFLRLANEGILRGDEQGNFNPMQSITRAEMAVMLARALHLSTQETSIRDAADMPSWSYGAFYALSERGILSGDAGGFRGNDVLLRGEAAAALNKALSVGCFSGGQGTAESPYLIDSAEQFVLINQNLSAHYKLLNDIVFTTAMPTVGSADAPFTGSFDGNFKRIVTTKSEEGSNVLFQSIGAGGTVSGIYLVCPQTRIALCGTNRGSITFCANTSWTDGTPDYAKWYGGIAAENYGIIEKCYNTSAVQIISRSYQAGGIAGYNKGTVKDCFNTGAVSAYCGGIAAENRGEIINCYTTAGKTAYKNNGTATNVYNGSAPETSFFADAFSYREGVVMLQGFPYFGNEDFVLFNGGDGSANNPYRVETAVHFSHIAVRENACFRQTADLYEISQSIPTFSGQYDGNGYTIYGLRIQENTAALFGKNRGVLQGVRITDGMVKGTEKAAGLVYQNEGIVENCVFDGLVSAKQSAGLCLENAESGTVKKCFTQGKTEAGKETAGLILQNRGVVQNCYAHGEIYGNTVGGLVHTNYGSLQNSYFAGTIAEAFGGIAYANHGTIRYCYTTAKETICVNTGKSSGTAAVSRMQFENAVTFVGFDFIGVWEAAQESDYLYPRLIENAPLTVKTENYTDFAGGNGSISNPFKIVTPAQFLRIRQYAGKAFKLMNDLELGGVASETDCVLETFSGVLDGDGHSIYGLNDRSLIHTNYGTVQNLYIRGAVQVTPLALYNEGTVEQCAFFGTLTAENGAGLVLYNNGLISACETDGQFTGEALAGIALYNAGQVQNCCSTVYVKGETLFGIAQNIDAGSVQNSWFGGYLAGRTVYPLAQTKSRQSFYLNYYGREDTEGKTLQEVKAYAANFGTRWVAKDDFPVLQNMPSVSLPLFDLEGDGSTEKPYQIRRAEQVKYMGMYKNAAFRLTQNLHMDSMGFTPFATFSGSLDGNFKTLYGLKIYGERSGFVQELKGRIENLVLADIVVEGSAETGAFASINRGVIRNCTVQSGSIGTAGLAAGAICGQNMGSGLLYGCANYADVFSASAAGGMAGINSGTLVLCQNNGGVVATAQAEFGFAGGIAGHNNGVVDRSYNNGKVLAYSESETAYAGGIAGENKGTVSNVYNTGEMHAKAMETAYAGGIVGCSRQYSEISAAYNTGFTNVTADKTAAGSAVGVAEGGSLYGFVYESTLASPIGRGMMQQQLVTERAIDVMYRKEGYEGFDFENTWFFDYDQGYYVAQLAENPQVTAVRTENITEFAGGDGSIDNPYRILTPEQLNNVRKHLGSAFVLLADIDMSGYCEKNTFMPIGDTVFSFFGLFIGNNYCISGLKISGDEFGIFRENHGEIYNCFFRNIRGNGSGGTVAAYNTGLLYNCMQMSDQYVQAENTAVNRGGLVGLNKSTGMIISSYNTGDIRVFGQSVQTGGIAYGNYGVISGCFNTGYVAANGAQLAVSGGLTAYNFGIISDCYNAREVQSVSARVQSGFGGGLVGNNGGTVVNAYFSGATVQGEVCGSIAATNTGSLSNCYFAGKNGCGRNNGESYNVRGCTDAALLQKETYDGFDFENMWIMDSDFRYKYPQLLEIAHRE